MKKNILLIGVFTFVLLLLIAYARWRQSGQQGELNIYVPCGMTIPFRELSEAYKPFKPGVKISFQFDSAGVLVKRISDKGDRPDIFVSPGVTEMENLQKKGLIDQASLRHFADYDLILVVPAGTQAINSMEDLGKEALKTFAIADPQSSSIGSAVREALRSFGLWEQVSPKMVVSSSPLEALTWVAMKKADAAIHYNACPFDTGSDKVKDGTFRIVATLAQKPGMLKLHSYIAILSGSANKRNAQEFIDFMFSKNGNNILKRYNLASTEAAGENALIQENPNAKVILEAYFPMNEEHLFIKDYLASLQVKFSPDLSVKIVDFRNDEGYKAWRKTGLTCGGILINGKNKAAVIINGQAKEVEFLKRPDMLWSRQELETAIEQELKK